MTIAVVGADFDLFVDDAPADRDAPFLLRAGARLRCGGLRRGARAYVAVAGGVATGLVLGSRATHLVSRMGGLDGRAVVAGDVLPVGVAADATRAKIRRRSRVAAWSRAHHAARHARARRRNGSPRTRSTRSSRDHSPSRRSRIAWGSGYEAPRKRESRGRDAVGARAVRSDSGAGRRRAHSADGRPANSRWLSEDRDRDHALTCPWPDSCRRATSSSSSRSRSREAMAALIAREREFLRCAREAGAW